ncbi:MAG: hypothetical protein LC659_09735, partial [Myxococcales bacterium]|nr:hypothetical protein [Myxococcales bacterium]
VVVVVVVQGVTGRARIVAALVAACGLGCKKRGGSYDAARALAEAAKAKLAPVSAAARRDYLKRARIFDDGDVATRDVAAGPRDPYAIAVDDMISCDFIEPRKERVPTGGTTPKFFCSLRHMHPHIDVKIRYGRDNREIYGEVLGSRLFWALGLAVDRNYPVRVRCHDCPADPWRAYRDFPAEDASPRATREIGDAVMQRLYPAAVIETRDDEGWSFAELDTVDEAAGGASRAEVDALRLLAAFVAHGDDKAANQRLVCPFEAIDADGRCRQPRLLVADLGSTFGRGASRVLGLIDKQARPSFAAWSSLPMWEDARACRAHLSARASASNPVVGEAGRRLLADRLSALADRQLRALFTVARVERMGETVTGSDGKARAVTVDDWVAAFKRRRQELVDNRCPE